MRLHFNVSLKENFLDKQIVDINGRKLVRVNDIRLVTLKDKTYAIAVDIGVAGLLRRIGIARQMNSLVSVFNKKIRKCETAKAVPFHLYYTTTII